MVQSTDTIVPSPTATPSQIQLSRTPSSDNSIHSGSEKKRASDLNSDGNTSPYASSVDEKFNSTAPLADRATIDPSSSLGDALLRGFGLRPRRKQNSLDSIATQESVFDGELAEQYYPPKNYENYAAFDPSFRWTWAEQKKTTRKTDIVILGWVLVMFMALDIDRYNLPNATADNFLGDLGLTQADYNLGNTMGRIGFLIAELPSQLISKRLGPDRWIPMQLIVMSIIAGSQFFLTGRATFLVTRFFMAFFQGGFIPDIILYLSYFYTKHELPTRLGIFYTVNYTSTLVTAFAATGLLQMRGILGKEGWRWMFLIEGIFTFIVGVSSFFMMPTGPTKTKTWFRPKGYFTDHQVKIIVNKVIRDDPTKSTMHNRQALDVKTIWRCVANYHMYPLYLIGLTFGLGAYPINQYFQLSMKQLGFTTLQANLLSVPNIVLSVFNLIVITVLSEIVDSRTWVAISENLWLLPNYIALLALPSPVKPWVYFSVATVLLGFPYVLPITVGWASRNSASVELRTVAASLLNMSVQVSGIIGANLYQASDKPRYTKANSAIVGIIMFNLTVVYPFAWWYYKSRNAKREAVWSKMTTEEKTEYLSTTTDKDNMRLDFRFAY